MMQATRKAALDAASRFWLYSESHWRRASEPDCYGGPRVCIMNLH